MHGKSSSYENVTTIKAKIEAIPGAMRQMGWGVSADLMERWLHSPAWVLPVEWKGRSTPDPRQLPSGHVDQHTVRMSWAMTHPRVRTALTDLRAKMANGPARKVLAERVAGSAWGTSHRIGFGTPNDSAIQLEKTCQSNVEPFGANLDTMDDLYGSLGMATLKVALVGHALRDTRTGRLALQVTHAGFYIRDTYDFNDFQYLGAWTKNGVLSKAQMLMNAATDGMTLQWVGEPIGNVFNHDFETYRCTTGFGGDFVIYSDVHWEPANLLLELT
jgi:hypothetical protein